MAAASPAPSRGGGLAVRGFGPYRTLACRSRDSWRGRLPEGSWGTLGGSIVVVPKLILLPSGSWVLTWRNTVCPSNTHLTLELVTTYEFMPTNAAVCDRRDAGKPCESVNLAGLDQTQGAAALKPRGAARFGAGRTMPR